MNLKYKITDDTIEVSGMDLTGYRHKKSVYLGSFYVKEIREERRSLIADYEEGDRPLVFYRDSIHDMHVGWKTPLVELVTSFMKVAYLVSRGVIYQPFEEPENFTYNIKKHRVQVVGRNDATLSHLDENFLDWVMEMIGFLISKEDTSNFGYLTHQEYYNNMDESHKDLYKGYLQQKDFQALVEYTLEPSVIEVLDQYTPITRIPIDNSPTIRDVLAKSVDAKEEYERKQQEKHELEMQEEELRVQQEKRLAEQKHELDNKGKNKSKVKAKGKKKKQPKGRKREKDKLEDYRKQLGIPEDKEKYRDKRKGANIIPTVLSLVFLGFALWLAYTFYIWIF